MTLLLDTTVLIDVLRNRRDRRRWLAQLVEQGHIFAVAAISVGEVCAGMRINEEARTDEFLSTLFCYPLTRALARRAGALVVDHARKGRTLTLADMTVAATALEHGLMLVTDKTKDFPIPDLKLQPLP